YSAGQRGKEDQEAPGRAHGFLLCVPLGICPSGTTRTGLPPCSSTVSGPCRPATRAERAGGPGRAREEVHGRAAFLAIRRAFRTALSGSGFLRALGAPSSARTGAGRSASRRLNRSLIASTSGSRESVTSR